MRMFAFMVGDCFKENHNYIAVLVTEFSESGASQPRGGVLQVTFDGGDHQYRVSVLLHLEEPHAGAGAGGSSG